MTEPDNTIARYKFSHEPKWSEDSNTNFIVPKDGVSVYITLKYILVSSKYLVRFKRIWNSVPILYDIIYVWLNANTQKMLLVWGTQCIGGFKSATKNMSVVYDIKKWFLLIYLLTAGRSESEPCYLYINALCRGAITKAATTEITVKIGVMQHKQLLVIKKVVALGRNFSERK